MWNSRPAPESAAAALATPVAPGRQPRTDEPVLGEQAPQATRHRPPPVRKSAPSRRLQPGDLICGACGEGNPPVRKFCSRCGGSLVEAEVVKRPWWKKLLPTRGPKVMPASAGGKRPEPAKRDLGLVARKIYRRLRIAVAVVVAIAGIGYGAIPSLRNAVDSRFNNAKSRVVSLVHPNYVPVHPVSVTANLHVSGHPPMLAADEFTNTYWLAPWNPDNEAMLTLKFGQKVTLKKVIIYSGVAANYVAYGRPAVLHLVFSNGQSDTIAPQDTDKAQTLSISNASGITSVEIQVAAVYPGSKGSTVAISEMEFFRLQL